MAEGDERSIPPPVTSVGDIAPNTFVESAKSSADSDIVEADYVDVVKNDRVVQAIDSVSDDAAYAGTMMMTWVLSVTDDTEHCRPGSCAECDGAGEPHRCSDLDSQRADGLGRRPLCQQCRSQSKDQTDASEGGGENEDHNSGCPGDRPAGQLGLYRQVELSQPSWS